MWLFSAPLRSRHILAAQICTTRYHQLDDSTVIFYDSWQRHSRSENRWLKRPCLRYTCDSDTGLIKYSIWDIQFYQSIPAPTVFWAFQPDTRKFRDSRCVLRSSKSRLEKGFQNSVPIVFFDIHSAAKRPYLRFWLRPAPCQYHSGNRPLIGQLYPQKRHISIFFRKLRS